MNVQEIAGYLVVKIKLFLCNDFTALKLDPFAKREGFFERLNYRICGA